MNRASLPHPHQPGTHLPLFILILVLLGIGLLTFRDYGLSWDEPLFYDLRSKDEHFVTATFEDQPERTLYCHRTGSAFLLAG